MRPANFEESEFEDPLYNQLERSSNLLWSPGQVLEARVGFDRSLLVRNLSFWRWLGLKKILRGAALNRYWWPAWWRPAGRPALPSFRQNLFLQAKRSLYAPVPPRAAKRLGFSGDTWAFRIKPAQQRSLEVLSKTTAGQALVAYAGPVFHTRADLFVHIIGRSIVRNSTFPSASRLVGHTGWYYQQPGSLGVANPSPERIEEPSLQNRLERLVSSAATEAIDLGEELGFLDRALVATVEETEDSEEVRTASFFNERNLIERFAEGVVLDPATYHYLLVLHAVETLDLSWLVVG